MITQQSWRMEIALYGEGDEVFKNIISDKSENAKFAFQVSKPKLWSAEHPNLYKLQIQLYDAKNNLQEIVRQAVGFREFRMKDGLMCINGQRIVFNGVNRHDFCADNGRVLTRDTVWKDLVTMKQNNINAVRTSHYPSTPFLYDMCDQLGLYVINENNMESHGNWAKINGEILDKDEVIPGDKPEYLDMMLYRVNETYHRDKNHPCIVIWSCGNESFGGSVIAKNGKTVSRAG